MEESSTSVTPDQMVIVPGQLLLEVEQFISIHRGITFAEAERAVASLRSYRSSGSVLYIHQQQHIGKLEDELKLMHEKISEMQKQVNGDGA